MNNKIRAQAALEYLMTYGWALIAIAVVIGAILLLSSQASSPGNCLVTPSSGALTYITHWVTNGSVNIILQNDTGKTISDLNASYANDFSALSASLSNGPYTSAQQFIISKSGYSQVGQYSGTINFVYKRNGVVHAASAICTGSSSS